MEKKFVRLYLEGINSVPPPYDGYIRERNGNVATDLAGLLGISYLHFARENREVYDLLNNLSIVSSFNLGIPYDIDRDTYHVPYKCLDAKTAAKLKIKNEGDFYGTVIDYPSQVGKSVLHPNVSTKAPSFYSQEFAKAVSNLVLPGFTAFNKYDLLLAYARLKKQPYQYRLKFPEESDGHGQFLLNDVTDLGKALAKIDDEQIARQGIVMEANLNIPQTTSVGLVIVGNKMFSFVAHQKNDVAPEDGRNRYLGADVIVIKGKMRDLTRQFKGKQEEEPISMAAKFYDCFSLFDPVSSRLSFDHLKGYDDNGNRLGGITDITARLVAPVRR